MEANLIPEVIRMEASDRMTVIVANYRIHVLPNHQVIVTKADFFTGKQVDWHTEEWDTHAEAMEAAEGWIENAVEDETIWCDEE